MHKRLMNFFERHKILYDLQFGFREGHNTSLALTYLIDKVISSLEKGEYVVGIFVDLSKAFDTVNHKILLGKLFRYGVRGVALDWLSSYLSNRTQYVSYNGVDSECMSISCGVPQGSILGPLMFLVYINDLASICNALLPVMYADDSNFFVAGKNIDDLVCSINTELKNIMNWMNINKLSVNAAKTKLMIFRPKRKKAPDPQNKIMINGSEVERVESIKFLGIMLDETLSWKNHIENIRSKISKGIGIIMKARNLLVSKTLLTLYYSFVYPHLSYCIEVWGSAYKTHLDVLLKLQKKALRIIHSVPKDHKSKMLFKSDKVLTIYQLYQYSVVLFMYKFVRQVLPPLFKGFFEHSTSDYDMRGQHLLRIPKCSSNFSQMRIRYTGTKLFNMLCSKVSRSCSYHTYKKNLKKYVIENSPIKNIYSSS